MDTETTEAVEALRTDIHRVEADVRRAKTSLTGEIGRVETSLTAEIGRVETSLTAEIGRVGTSLTAEIGRVETSLTGEIARVETSLTVKMYELNDDTKRHADIQFESVRDDIRMVAEAVVALGTKVDSLRR